MTSDERKLARYNRRVSKRNKLADVTYDQIFSYKNIYESMRKCMLSVGWKPSIQRYKNHVISNATKLYNILQKRKFKSKGFYEFTIVERGKTRHIKSVNIEERVVQRCFCDYGLVPAIMPKLIYDNAACLEGRGYDFSINRITKHLSEFYKKNGVNGWILQFDISKYFESIPHDKMISAVSKIFTDKDIIKLYTELVHNMGDGVGLGLGSQISQISAVYYLNPLDHYLKDKLKIKYYGRYMDDAYIISEDKNVLFKYLEDIKSILNELGLTLSEKKTSITKLTKGFTYLKTRFSFGENGKIIKKPYKKSIVIMRRKIKSFAAKIKNGEMTYADAYASYQSWCGYIKRFHSHETLIKMQKLFQEVIADDNLPISCDFEWET